MGKSSREKRKRRLTYREYETDSTPFSISNLLTPGAFLLGLYIASFGVGLCTTNRWGPNTGYLSPHPWAIPIGGALVLFALWRHGKGR
jgi:hypothetical protein